MPRNAKFKDGTKRTEPRRRKRRPTPSVPSGPASGASQDEPLNAPSAEGAARALRTPSKSVAFALFETMPPSHAVASSSSAVGASSVPPRAHSSESVAVGRASLSGLSAVTSSDTHARAVSGTAVERSVEQQQQHDEEPRAKRRRFYTFNGNAGTPLDANFSFLQPLESAESSRTGGLTAQVHPFSTMSHPVEDLRTVQSDYVADEFEVLMNAALAERNSRDAYEFVGADSFCCVTPKIVHCDQFKNAIKSAMSGTDSTIDWSLLKPFVNVTEMDVKAAYACRNVCDGIDNVDKFLEAMTKEHFLRTVCYHWRIESCHALLTNLCENVTLTVLGKQKFRFAGYFSDIYGKCAKDVLAVMKEQKLVSEEVALRKPVRPLETGPVEKMFGIRYVNRDNMVDSFHALVKHYASQWQGNIYLAPYMSMVQASMVGKSRLVQQLSLRCFVIPMVFRDNGSTGYPPVTNELLVKQLAPNPNVPPKVATVRWVQYLAYMLQKVAEFIRGSQKSQNVDQNIFEAWSAFFYSRVEAAAATDLADSWEDLDENLASDFPSKAKLSDAIINLSEAANEAKLRETLVVFVMDEARALLKEQQVIGEQISGFRAFRRALKLLPGFVKKRKVYCFSIVMDTVSKVANFSPANFNEPSLRLSKPTLKLYPPYCEIPTIDILADTSRPTLKSLQRLGHLCEPDLTEFQSYNPVNVAKDLYCYGRPHWGACLKVEANADLSLLLHVARHKLLGDDPDISDSGSWSIEMRLAILDCRLGMHITSRSHVASELVSNHMALCAAISEDRMMIKCQYPSEPILAMAAATFWNGQNKDKSFQMDHIFEGLVEAYSSELIATGNRGELMTKILLALAWDRCFSQIDEVPYLPYGTPVCVKRFLRIFIGFDATEAPFKDEHNQWCVGDVVSDSVAQRQLFMDGHVFFTHFIRADWVVTFDKFDLFFRRGAAIMCKNNHPGIDFIVPVLLTNKRMSAIIIQTKNISGSDPNLPNGRFTASASASGIVKAIDVPYMTLYQQFGDKNSSIVPLSDEQKVKKSTAASEGSSKQSTASSANVAQAGKYKSSANFAEASKGKSAAHDAAEASKSESSAHGDAEEASTGKDHDFVKPPDRPFQAAYAIRGFSAAVYPFLKHIPNESRSLLQQFFDHPKKTLMQKYNDHCVWRMFPLCKDPENEPSRIDLAKESSKLSRH